MPRMTARTARSRSAAAAGSSLLLAAGCVAGCGVTVNHPAQTTAAQPQPAGSPLSAVVFLGDSLTAGMQNNALLDSLQAHSFPALIAQQAGFTLVQPLIAPPGVPNELQLVRRGFPVQLTALPGASIGRENPAAQATNLAVPGQTTENLISLAPAAQSNTELQNLTNLVLGYPAGGTGSQLDEAVALQPSTIFLCIGANDAIPALATGDPSTMTPLAAFTARFSRIVATLHAKTAAHLIVANIPDLTLFPYMTPAPVLAQEAAAATGQPAAAIQQELGLGPGDLVNQTGLNHVIAQLDPIRAGVIPAALPPQDVLTAAEVQQTQVTIQSYNRVIAEQVSAAGGTVVDFYGYFHSLQGGITIDGTQATLGFLGGLFSLDGIHPDNTLYALLANQVIAGFNAELGTAIAPVDVSAVAAGDPLF